MIGLSGWWCPIWCGCWRGGSSGVVTGLGVGNASLLLFTGLVARLALAPANCRSVLSCVYRCAVFPLFIVEGAPDVAGKRCRSGAVVRPLTGRHYLGPVAGRSAGRAGLMARRQRCLAWGAVRELPADQGKVWLDHETLKHATGARRCQRSGCCHNLPPWILPSVSKRWWAWALPREPGEFDDEIISAALNTRRM